MEFGIIEITNGWFNWYLEDDEKRVEITSSRYAEDDFVKQLLVSLTEFIRDKKEKRFSIYADIRMKLALKSLKKKYKSTGFAAGCSREVIARGAEQLGWELDTLLERTLKAMTDSEDTINALME